MKKGKFVEQFMVTKNICASNLKSLELISLADQRVPEKPTMVLLLILTNSEQVCMEHKSKKLIDLL